MIRGVVLVSFLFLGILSADELSQKKQGMGISYGVMGLGVSYFDKARYTEIFGSIMNYSDDIYEDGYDENKEQEELHVSLHYRKFFRPKVAGYYYGGFARYTKLEGKLKDEHSRATQSKFGVGAEVGYTSFGLLNYPTLFWNVGLGAGAYLSGEHEIFEGDEMLGDIPVVIHLDIFRLGLVF